MKGLYALTPDDITEEQFLEYLDIVHSGKISPKHHGKLSKASKTLSPYDCALIQRGYDELFAKYCG